MTHPGPIRVASIPANHPYVRHLSPTAGPDDDDGVVRLPDPPPNVPDPLPGQWWPPVMLERDWVAGQHRDFDLSHLHFGFDAAEPADLQRWTAELAGRGKPLVMTVHDLVNPHFADQRSHTAQLDVLIPAADEIITLTPGAARTIRERWGRTAEVIPHPHVVPLDELPALPGAEHDGRVLIGVHAKSLRANVDPLPVLMALDTAMQQLAAVHVRVDLHPDVLQRNEATCIALWEWLQHRAGDDRWQVSVHPMFTDAELWAYLGALDLCVLPYRFGTHSGWLEACVDLGTGVLVPDVGCYAEQHGHPSYPRSADGTVDAAGFAAALRGALTDPTRGRRARPDRAAQRRRIAQAHHLLYRRALDRVQPVTA